MLLKTAIFLAITSLVMCEKVSAQAGRVQDWANRGAAALSVAGATQAASAPSGGRTLVTTDVSGTRVSGRPSTAPEIATVEVFANSAILLSNTRQAKVYLLDGLEQVSASLSAGLPSDQVAAQRIVQQRLRSMGASTLQQRTQSSAEGIALAARYGIDRVPAVVFNGAAVVYGETDIDVARAHFRRSSK